LKSEEARKQIILVVDCPITREAEAFLSQSIASNPAIVRRAVLKDWNPPIFGMFFFTRKWLLSIPCWRCLVT
jgi:hypothetical protein